MQALLELRCTLPEHFYAYKRTYAERGTYFRSHIRFVTQRWTMTVTAHLPTYPGDESVTTSVNRSCSLVGRGWGDHIWPDLEYPRGSAGCCAPSLAVGESPLASLGLSRCPARWAWVRRRQRQVTSLSPMLGGRSALPAWAAGMTSAGVAVDRSLPPPCCLGHSAMGPASDPQSSPTPTCPWAVSLPASLAPPHLSQVTSPLGRKSGAVRFSQTAWLQTSDGPAEAPRPGAAEPEPPSFPLPGRVELPACGGRNPGSQPGSRIPACALDPGLLCLRRSAGPPSWASVAPAESGGRLRACR